MAATIRRHWGMVALLVLTALTAGGWLILSSAIRAQSVGEATAIRPAPQPLPEMDPSLYSQIQRVRQELNLTDGELAALGCTPQDAMRVLETLRLWCESRKAALDQADRNSLQAQANLQEVTRRINIGPCDRSLVDQVPQLQRQIASTDEQRQQLLAAAVPAIASRLSADQNKVWQTVRSNRKASGPYRYAPDLTTDQLRALDSALAQYGKNLSQVSVAEQQVLSESQRLAIAKATLNRRQCMAGVLAAKASVLPTPRALAPVIAAGAR